MLRRLCPSPLSLTTDRLSPESHLVCPPSSLLSYSSPAHVLPSEEPPSGRAYVHKARTRLSSNAHRDHPAERPETASQSSAAVRCESFLFHDKLFNNNHSNRQTLVAFVWMWSEKWWGCFPTSPVVSFLSEGAFVGQCENSDCEICLCESLSNCHGIISLVKNINVGTFFFVPFECYFQRFDHHKRSSAHIHYLCSSSSNLRIGNLQAWKRRNKSIRVTR